MITGSPRLRRRRPQKTEFPKIDLVHEEVNHPDQIVLVDPVFQPVRKQRYLAPVRALDIPRHACLRSLPKAYLIRSFHTASARKL